MNDRCAKTKLLSYVWKGKDINGNVLTGDIQAINIRFAKAELLAQKIVIEKISRKREFCLIKNKSKISTIDITLFLRQLTTLFVSGVPLLQALDIMAQSSEKQALKKLLFEIKKSVRQGCSLTSALKQHGKYFDQLTCSLIFAGEQTGTLDTILERVTTYREKIFLLRQSVKKALFYPCAVIIVAFCVTYILLVFVVPQFAELFSGFGAQLPWLTQMVIKLSNMLRQFWWLIMLCVILPSWLFLFIKRRSKVVTKFLDTFILRIPFLGKVVQKAIIARLLQTLAVTFSAGVPLLKALQFLKNIANNVCFHVALIEVHNSVCEGQSLHESLQMSKLFPNIIIQMVAIGEEAGKLAHMLTKVANFYENEVNQLVSGLNQLLEPLIMVILGVIIGGLVIAMYLPIFKLGMVI